MTICAVIMAGGSGTRLWPKSRSDQPKQFFSIADKNSMLQSTINRLEEIEVQSISILCNERHRFLVAEQLREINKIGSIILEPIAKNTAPAIALAALMEKDDSLLLVLASDHIIKDLEIFQQTIRSSIPLAESGKLVTFGIEPREANTGYGYIKRGLKKGCGFFVDKFVEKPSIELAKSYIESGNYYWNSGMFLFKASRYLEELEKFQPEIFSICKSSILKKREDSDFIRINPDIFEKCPNKSIDYAVMENTSDAVVVPMNTKWSDVGSWSSLWEIGEKDNNGNVKRGDVIIYDTCNSYIDSDNQLVTVIGLANIVLVVTKDAVLLADKDKVNDVQLIVDRLKSDSRKEWKENQKIIYPWGSYDYIENQLNHKIRRISIKPGAVFLPTDNGYNIKNWVVVSGEAKLVINDEIITLNKNDSISISNDSKMEIKSSGKNLLVLIEVQT